MEDNVGNRSHYQTTGYPGKGNERSTGTMISIKATALPPSANQSRRHLYPGTDTAQ